MQFRCLIKVVFICKCNGNVRKSGNEEFPEPQIVESIFGAAFLPTVQPIPKAVTLHSWDSRYFSDDSSGN